MISTPEEQQIGDEYLLNLFLTPEGIANPAPWYKKLREDMPIFESSNGALFLSRFDDCQSVFRDNRFGKGDQSGPGGSMLPREESPEIIAFRQEVNDARTRTAPSLLFLDPPDHTRLRGLVNRAFTPRRIDSMRMSIRDLTEECLDELSRDGGGDAMEILGFLPVNVIGELVGVPRSDWNYFRPLVNDGVANLEASPTLEELKASHAAFTEMGEYFRQLLHERNKNPQND